MAVPKSRTSHARKMSRRSSVWKLSAPTLSTCPKCNAVKLPHRACRVCGQYNGRQVMQPEQ